MEEPLNREERKVLRVLYEEMERNPQTSLVGIDETTLGYNVGGAYRGIAVMYSVAQLDRLGLVAKGGTRVMLTQKGISMAKPRFVMPKGKGFLVWLRDNIFVALLIAVVGGLMVAVILTHWHP